MYPPALIAEETARIVGGNLTLDGYLRAHRGGSTFRLSRTDRRAIYDEVLTALCGTVQGRARAAQIAGFEAPAHWLCDPAPPTLRGGRDYEKLILDEQEDDESRRG